MSIEGLPEFDDTHYEGREIHTEASSQLLIITDIFCRRTTFLLRTQQIVPPHIKLVPVGSVARELSVFRMHPHDPWTFKDIDVCIFNTTTYSPAVIIYPYDDIIFRTPILIETVRSFCEIYLIPFCRNYRIVPQYVGVDFIYPWENHTFQSVCLVYNLYPF